MAQFSIQESFPISSKGLFVFVGELVSGAVEPGMEFLVPEAGHKWRVRVRSIERVQTAEGVKVALVVDDAVPSYLAGVGVGWTAEITENAGQQPTAIKPLRGRLGDGADDHTLIE
jgi:hypothetical protein